jgi:preprotein translocase subunit SecD
MLLLPIMSLLLLQQEGGDAVLRARIQQLLHLTLTTDDDKQEEAAEAEAKEIFTKRGLPTVAAVGDEAAYEFVLLTCSPGPAEFQNQVLRKALEAARKHEVPADAVSYCAAHVRQETVKALAKKQAPSNPALRDRIERLYKVDQAVREKQGFDMKKMEGTDREHAAALEEIFGKYGVPTYRMVGPQAAGGFITMIQHQSPEFRRKVLPVLKANVDAGQADPGSYAMVLDRSQTDAGKKQTYGENLTCDKEHPKLHTGPIEDEDHVDQRRAAIGLMRLKLYAQLVVAMSPNVCPATPSAK